MSAKIEGLEKLERALQAKVKAAGGEMSNKFVTLSLQAVSAQTAPFVPVDTSNLINSEYRKTQPGLNGWNGELGYAAGYGVYVHEGPQKNWQKPGASKKFLEKGVDAFVKEDADRLIEFAFKGLTE